MGAAVKVNPGPKPGTSSRSRRGRCAAAQQPAILAASLRVPPGGPMPGVTRWQATPTRGHRAARMPISHGPAVLSTPHPRRRDPFCRGRATAARCIARARTAKSGDKRDAAHARRVGESDVRRHHLCEPRLGAKATHAPRLLYASNVFSHADQRCSGSSTSRCGVCSETVAACGLAAAWCVKFKAAF